MSLEADRDVLTATRKLPDGKQLGDLRRLKIIAAIEAERQRQGLSMNALAERAGIRGHSYYRIKSGASRSHARVLRRLAIALAGSGTFQPVTDINIVRMMHDGFRLKLAPLQLPPVMVRHVAIYLLHVECGVSQGLIATLCGVTLQAISKTARQIEDLRDDNAVIDRAIALALAPVDGQPISQPMRLAS